MLTCDMAIAQYHLKLVPAGAAGPLECAYIGLGLDGRSRAPLWLHPYLLRLGGWRRSSGARHLRQQILRRDSNGYNATATYATPS